MLAGKFECLSTAASHSRLLNFEGYEAVIDISLRFTCGAVLTAGWGAVVGES